MTVAVLGEALIDLIMSDSGEYRPHLGGSPFNVSIALARQGVPVSYLAPFSDDSFGDQLIEALRREGTLLPDLPRSRWPTSLALVTIDALGQPSYRLYREGIADKDIDADEVIRHLPGDLRVFHTGSLAITPSQLPKIRELFEEMRRRDVLISMDINIRLRGSLDTERYLAGVRSLLPECDFVKASDEDIQALGIDDDLAKSAAVLSDEIGDGVLVLTEGTGGAKLYSAQGQRSRPSYPIANVVDTVGAGDTFHAAFLAALHHAGCLTTRPGAIALDTLTGALDYACAAAAINVSRKGCSPPTREEVTRFMAAAARR